MILKKVNIFCCVCVDKVFAASIPSVENSHVKAVGALWATRGPPLAHHIMPIQWADESESEGQSVDEAQV